MRGSYLLLNKLYCGTAPRGERHRQRWSNGGTETSKQCAKFSYKEHGESLVSFVIIVIMKNILYDAKIECLLRKIGG